MAYFSSDNPIIQVLRHADMLSLAVISGLFFLSVISWALFFGKVVILQMKKRQLRTVSQLVMHAKTIDDLRALAHKFSKTLPGYFIAKNLVTFKTIMDQRRGDDTIERRRNDAELMRYEIERQIESTVETQDAYLTFFSTTAAVGPLLGLFGTIWGLIHSFLRISQFQSADIVTIAPGIAEALITTLGGLVVAIPALVMYNFCLALIRSFERELAAVADKVGMLTSMVLIGK